MCEVSTNVLRRQNAKISRISNIRDRFLYLLLQELGLTVSEVANLTKDQFKNTFLHIDSRVISLSSILWQTFQDYVHTYKPHKFVFFTRQSPQMTTRRIQQILQKNNLASPQNLRRNAVISSLETNDIQIVREQFNLKSLREKQYLTKFEFERLISNIPNQRDKLIASIFYETGITAFQLTQIKHKDIYSKSTLAPLVYSISAKGQKKGISVAIDERLKEPRTHIPISNKLFKLLFAYSTSGDKSHSKYLFSSRQSDTFSVRRIEQILNSYSSLFDFTLTPQIIANSARVTSQSFSKLRTHEVSQHTPRIYEGYFSQKKNGGENEIT